VRKLLLTRLIAAWLALGFASAVEAAMLSAEEALAERVLGRADAPVTIIEYSSLTCPHCASFHRDTLPRLVADYIDSGKAKLVFRDFPLDGRAMAAAMLARCGPPERYFGFLEVLFRSQDRWGQAKDGEEALTLVGQLGGMSKDDVASCLKNEALFQGIHKIKEEGQAKFKVESTPTFIINGEVLEGARSYETFDKILRPLANKP